MAVALLVSGCTSSTGEQSGEPTQPTPTVETERSAQALPGDGAGLAIDVAPGVVTDQDSLALTFPEAYLHDTYYVFFRFSDDGAAVAFFARSDTDGSGGEVYPAESVHGRDEEGAYGPGPDKVPLPEALSPGNYRVCEETGTDRPTAESFIREYEACGDFVVEGPEQ